MRRTKFLAVSGLILTLSSLIQGPGVWGYQRAVLMLQLGVLFLGLGMFFRITAGTTAEPWTLGQVAQLYDLEGRSVVGRRPA